MLSSFCAAVTFIAISKSYVRGKIILIVRFILTIYWTVGWCYRLATRKYPKIPYVEKNITINGTVIGTVRDP